MKWSEGPSTRQLAACEYLFWWDVPARKVRRAGAGIAIAEDVVTEEQATRAVYDFLYYTKAEGDRARDALMALRGEP